MVNTWIADIRHYLNEDGNFPEDLPRPALNLATYFCSIVEAFSKEEDRDNSEKNTDVQCRRRPGRRRCSGRIIATLQPDDQIRWYCPVCNDNGYISGWRGTHWDLSKKKRV